MRAAQLRSSTAESTRTLFGTIPLLEGHAEETEVAAAMEELQCMQTFGCIVADGTGLGKTKEGLLALAFAVAFHSEVDDASEIQHKPSLLAVPAAAVAQWAEEIARCWPMFILVISYDKEAIPDKLKERVISPTAYKKFATKGTPLKDFQYVFKTDNARASNVVMLTSVDTHAERAARVEIEVTRKALSFIPPRHNRKGKEIFEKPEETKKTYSTNLVGRWEIAIVDEAHCVKTLGTRNFAGIYSVQAKYKILLTATSMQNKQSDILGLMMIIWQGVKDVVHSDTACTSLEAEVGVNSRRYFEWLEENNEELQPDDKRRLMALSPQRLSGLLRTNNPSIIQKFYHLADTLVVLSRSPASRIWVDQIGQGKSILLRDNMQPHTIYTTTLRRAPVEEKIYQWLHREAAQAPLTG